MTHCNVSVAYVTVKKSTMASQPASPPAPPAAPAPVSPFAGLLTYALHATVLLLAIYNEQVRLFIFLFSGVFVGLASIRCAKNPQDKFAAKINGQLGYFRMISRVFLPFFLLVDRKAPPALSIAEAAWWGEYFFHLFALPVMAYKWQLLSICAPPAQPPKTKREQRREELRKTVEGLVLVIYRELWCYKSLLAAVVSFFAGDILGVVANVVEAITTVGSAISVLLRFLPPVGGGTLGALTSVYCGIKAWKTWLKIVG